MLNKVNTFHNQQAEVCIIRPSYCPQDIISSHRPLNQDILIPGDFLYGEVRK